MISCQERMVSFSSLLITNPGPKVHGPPMNVIILAPVFGKLSYLKKYLHTSKQKPYYENKRILALRTKSKYCFNILIKITSSNVTATDRAAPTARDGRPLSGTGH